MKLSVKLTLYMLGLLSLLFGIGGSLLISTSFQVTLEREKEGAYNAYQMVLGTLQVVNSIQGPSDYEEISQTLEQLSRQNAGSFSSLRLYSDAGPIYEYGSKPVSSGGKALPGSCTIRCARGGDGARLLTLSGALQAGGETLYLDMARDISPLFASRHTQQQIYLLVFLLMAALCALLSYSISRVLTRPLVRLSKVSRAIAKGELSSRADIRTGDEIGLLARDFNAMAGALEEKIAQLREAVERQERVVGSFAQEMKTAMTSIIGYADLIRGQTLSAGEQAEAANYIVSEGKRLENLSQKLLELLVLKNTRMAFSKARPAALIGGLAARLGPVYERQGIVLSCVCGEGGCLLEPELIKSLLINLFDNARKALEGKGGRITVRAVMLPDGCEIAISDDGRGIPPEALEHLTEAFYRVDRSRARQQGGVGLGLALCREIANLHGGSLHFDSRPGEGTTVTVKLRGGAA